jgi:hypothetical protein
MLKKAAASSPAFHPRRRRAAPIPPPTDSAPFGAGTPNDDLGRPQTTNLGPLRSPPPNRVTHAKSATNAATSHGATMATPPRAKAPLATRTKSTYAHRLHEGGCCVGENF